jgi:glycosyltransferase involved in cell wall biosynthesis
VSRGGRGAREPRAQRLLFVGTNRGPGGTESHLVALALGLADAGYEVAAVVRRDDVIARALAVDGRIAIHHAAFEEGESRQAARDLADACRIVRPAWILGNFVREFWPLSIVARTQRIPLALFLHIQKISRWSAPLYPWLASRFIVPSHYLRRWVVRRRAMPPWRTSVLYNPIDVTRFRPDAARREGTRRELGFTPDDVVVGYAGRFDPQKGVQVLASALEGVLAQAPKARALWVGDGNLGSRIDAAIAASPYAGRHLRRPWSSDVAHYFAAMDVLAFPSVKRETFGRVAAEAQACGVPVVATRVGGIPETLRENESGLLVPPEDAPAMTDALLRLVTDASLRARMGVAGRAQAAERFATPRIVAEFARLLKLGQ